MNEEFVVERFEGEVSERPFGIVHIASHGEFTADASESFLLAYDGKLSMDRLAELVAATRFREDQPLELLTLSACQTAAGDDRAALGLAGVAAAGGRAQRAGDALVGERSGLHRSRQRVLHPARESPASRAPRRCSGRS